MIIRYPTTDELSTGQRDPHRQVVIDGDYYLRTDPITDAGRESNGEPYSVHIDVPLGAERWDYHDSSVVVSITGRNGGSGDDEFLDIDPDSLPQLIAALTTAGLAVQQLRKDHS